MKKLTLVLLLISLASCSSDNSTAARKSMKNVDSEMLFEIVNTNIDLFNQESKDGQKPTTHYQNVTDYYEILSPYSDKTVGTLLIFDHDKGYVSISNERCIMDSNYESGINLVGNRKNSKTIYYLAHTYSFNKELLFEKTSSISGGSIYDYFYWHSDSTWTSEKTRYMQLETDSSYLTLVNTSNVTYRNKLTWSTYQGDNSYCGAFALANLIWTYKINYVVDLSGGVSTSSYLASAFETQVPSNASASQMLNVNTFFSETGYYIDYCNIVDGIEDTLVDAPLIVLYNPETLLSGHYALVTGKGRSLYQTIFWIDFYTSWDIVNTWSDRYSTNGNYYSCKYWIDNQYASFGYVLRDSSGDTVAL